MASPMPVFMPCPPAGTMDMRRVAEQEGASFPEMLRHAVVDVIGRKPVYFFDLDLKALNDPTTDILKFECISVIGTFVPYRPD